MLMPLRKVIIDPSTVFIIATADFIMGLGWFIRECIDLHFSVSSKMSLADSPFAGTITYHSNSVIS